MKTTTGQKLKRILACFLSVCMLANMAPISIAQEAQAEQITPTEENVQNTVSGSDGAAFFAFTRNASQTLTLANAISLAENYKAGHEGITNCPIIAEEDTLKIYNGEGLILLSQVNPAEYQNKKLILLVQGASSWDLVESVTIGDTEYRYQGLGDETYPYCGVLSLDSSAQSYSIRTTSPLFQAISETAIISNTLHFALDEDTGTAQPLLAAQVNDVPESPDVELTCSVSINKGTNASSVGTFGGIVGTVKENAKLSLSLSNQCTDTLSVTGASDIGLFCNVMETGSALTAELAESKGGITITATAQGGNAGGIVGQITDAELSFTGNAITNLTIDAGTNGNTGGIAGKYTNSKEDGSIDLTGFQISVTLGSTGSNVGGVFGTLKNTGTGKFTIKGASEAEGNHVDSVLTGSGKPTGYGGLVGIYQTSSKDSKLMIQNLSIHSAVDTNNSSAFDTYGGVLGKIITEVSQNAPDNTYVSFQNLTVSSDFNNSNHFNLFGGIIGAMDGKGCFLKGEDLTVSCGSPVNAGEKRGGLFGYMEGGVLRLSGTTDLSGMHITAARWRGQLIGLNNNGLVYGVGDGNGTYGGTTGWKLIRSASSTASDSGSWGQVLRLDGVVLKETTTASSDENTLLFYDESANTVQIQNPGADENGTYTIHIQNTRDFAAYALAYNYANAGGSALLKRASVDPSRIQQVVLSGDIDLTGTGILGVGRDHNGTAFRGSFDGGNHSITVDLGGRAFGVIGDAVATTTEGAGGLQVFDDAHTQLGLFAGIGSNTVIRNLEVKGTVLAGSSSNNNARFLSALAAKANGTISIQNVTVGANVKAASNSTFYQAGFVAQTLEGSNISFENCTWSGTLQNNCKWDDNEIGGFLADAQAGVKIAFRNCVLSGRIVEESEQLKKTRSHAGGLVARFQHNKDKKNTITIENVILRGVNMDVRYGGLLGNSWPRTDVVFGGAGEKGVTVTGCTLNTHNDSFGGLVRQASGYWNATASHSIVFEKNGETANSFQGSASETYPSALLVHSGLVNQDNTKSALYLEIGTWGVSGAAYYIAPEAVTVNVPNRYFDELAGITIDAVEGHDNAVVSLEHATPAEGKCFATYQGQLTNKEYDNSKSRYYYNLNCYRNSYKQPDGTSSLTPGGVDAPDKVLLWSVAQYAAENIRVLFCGNANAAATITGTMDWKEYSYYPVTPLGEVNLNEAVVSFYEKNFEDNAEENRKPSNAKKQHYLMHYGLFYNVERNLSANGLTLKGTVGKLSDSAGSGALILNKASGDLTSLPVRITELQLNRVVLNGILINGMSESETYAPLLMNRVDAGVKLGINDLTLSGYSGGAEKAATSLVGRVGSTAAKMITLYFEKLGLNGKIDQSIFTRATILESFQYASESSGAYNFLSTDTKVTYGVELSNSGENGRNPDLQFCYYDGGYVTDEEKVDANEAYVKTRFKRKDPLFLPYVAFKEDFSEYHELDINQKASGFTEGCGTYGDPYLIGDGQQLTDLAKFLEEPRSVTGFNVNFCMTVTTDEEGQTGTMLIGQPQESYHTSTQSASDYVDILFRWDGTQWSKVEGEQNYPEVSVSVDDTFHNNAVLYLRNAYYQLKNDVSIPLSGSTYKGIGSEKNPFCGVIDGAGRTVSFTGTKDNQTNFGGLVSYSCGSVIRNITLDYATGGAKITLNNSAVPSSTNHPFFGGLVGYCMGGDTIIEQASVIFPEKPVQVQEASEERGIALTGVNGYDRLIAAGGYVGIVGGARNKDGYEPYGGGVIFRNMSGTTHNFRTIGEKQDGANTYFYCNPIAGRVLDGYVCYAAGENEGGITLDNTDKNYTIPVLQSLQSGTEDLKVTKNPEADSQYNITVNSPQGLWLLSAIVNSGAGAMDGDGQYKDVDSRFVEAYQLGKTRSASADYSKIGTVLGIDTLRSKALADEENWGGTSVNNRVSYLVTAYTLPESDGTYYASRMSGKSSGSDASNTVNLTFGVDSIDMSGYQNGFRGIGASYGDNYNVWNSNVAVKKVYRRTLRCASVSGAENQTTLKLQMERHDYDEEYGTRDEGGDGWANQGVGLFVSFSCTGTCTVSNLVISGNAKAINYQISDGAEKALSKNNIDVTAGGFTGRTMNSSGTLIFSGVDLKNLIVYGGTSTGGLIGLTEQTGGSTSIQILDWSISKLTVSKNVTNDGSTGGLVGWQHSKSSLKIGDETNPCSVDGLYVSVLGTSADSNNAGGLVGGVNNSNITVTNVTMNNLQVNGRKSKAISGVAAMVSGGAIEIQNFRMENASVVGDGCTYVGGLAGTTNSALQLYNVMLSGVAVMSGTANCNAGCFAGDCGELKGYNVLMTGCSAALKENVTATSSTKLGRFVGNANSRKIQLVAVAADSRTVPQNQDLGGTVSQGNTKIIYGDYAAAKEDFPYPGDIAVDRNPDSGIQIKDGATLRLLTGNAVGSVTTQEGASQSIAEGIARESATQNISKTYYNSPDISAVLDSSEAVYLTTYQTEEILSSTVPENMDFPILVLNRNATDCNTRLWNYIGAMVNVGPVTGYSGIENIKRLVNQISVSTCKWDSEQNCFVKGTCEGLVLNDKTFSMTGVYDNQKNQFTLVDVTFTDPTGKKSNGYHLYVPVLVKKVLEVKFTAKFLAGTNYDASIYPSAMNYATADFDEPVTAYMEYNYNRMGTEWQKMLDDGEDLLWFYDKYLDLAQGSSAETPLPAGTRLTLVDRQTGTYYSSQVKDGDNVHRLNLSELKDYSGKAFAPVPICDLLGITVTTYSDSGTAYVVEANPENATVRVGETYYRVASETDEGTKYALTVGNDIPSVDKAENYLPKGEGYYLTIQVPKTEGVDALNHYLGNTGVILKSGNGAPAALIRKSSSSSYVLYEGVTQNFKPISTVRMISGETASDDVVMENGDSIRISLECELSLTDAGKQYFANLGPRELHHQFDIHMRKYLKDVTSETVIGAEGATYTYVVKQGETTVYETNVTIQGSENLDALKIRYGSEDLKKALINGNVTVSATVILSYPLAGQYFPARSGESDQSGISVAATSRVANVASQLPIVSNRQSKEEGKRYYTKDSSGAKLCFNTYDKEGVGDAIQQLGINPSDNVNQLMNLIYAQGDYDYSAVSEGELTVAKQICYKLELFRKNDDGSYHESSPLGQINEYLPILETEGGEVFTPDASGTSMSLVQDFSVDKDSLRNYVKLKIVPLTGAEFEDKGFSYANYKLRLTVVLLDEAGNDLPNTKASDYIIYTNARIYQQLFLGTD